MITKSERDWLLQQTTTDSKNPERLRSSNHTTLDGKHILIVGGGTAGYMSALALQHQTKAKITLIESKAIKPIGVGEATVNNIVEFIRDYLGIDTVRFYSEVRPTWKVGIRFEWGLPGPYRFFAPFDWGTDSIGALGSAREHGDLSEMSVGSMLMAHDRVPLFRMHDGRIASMLHGVPVAYHFDVRRLNAFFSRIAAERGITVMDATIRHVEINNSGMVSAVATDQGRHEADFFVDCSGFKSLIIGQHLHSEHISFSSSLFTDRALAFEQPHGGHIKSYTTATTMDHGWLWNIPQIDEDHCGYVYSSSFSDETKAWDEVERRFGKSKATPRLVKFTSGRRSKSWIGNCAAIGNASGFVEPLESSGLLMTTICIRQLITALLRHRRLDGAAKSYNEQVADNWDGLRWFLSIHYRFNRASHSEFWQAARATADISGAEPLVECFRELAPLRLFRDQLPFRLRSSLLFYGLSGVDCVLSGQRVEAAYADPAEPQELWRARRDEVRRLCANALTMKEALALPNLAQVHTQGGSAALLEPTLPPSRFRQLLQYPLDRIRARRGGA